MTWEPVNPKDVFYAKPEEGTCPNCGCSLTLYEIFACRIRGLKQPVCLGCLAEAVAFMKRQLLPMLEDTLKALNGSSEKAPERREKTHSTIEKRLQDIYGGEQNEL